MKTGQFVKKLTSLLLMLTMLFSMPLYLCAPMLLWLCAQAKPIIRRKHQ